MPYIPDVLEIDEMAHTFTRFKMFDSPALKDKLDRIAKQLVDTNPNLIYDESYNLSAVIRICLQAFADALSAGAVLDEATWERYGASYRLMRREKGRQLVILRNPIHDAITTICEAADKSEVDFPNLQRKSKDGVEWNKPLAITLAVLWMDEKLERESET